MLYCTRRVTPRMLSCLIPEGAPPVTTLQLGRLITAHSPCSAPPPAAHPTEGQEGNRQRPLPRLPAPPPSFPVMIPTGKSPGRERENTGATTHPAPYSAHIASGAKKTHLHKTHTCTKHTGSRPVRSGPAAGDRVASRSGQLPLWL